MAEVKEWTSPTTGRRMHWSRKYRWLFSVRGWNVFFARWRPFSRSRFFWWITLAYPAVRRPINWDKILNG